MSQESPIVEEIAEVLTEQDWPHGRTLEQCLSDVEAVTRHMLTLLKRNERDVCVGYKMFAATDKGPP